jgi:UDP-glucose:(heptosyl)LPS alpha-1,3-glucosyltransferase
MVSMKIAIVRYKYSPYGGAERIIERLAQEFINSEAISQIMILSHTWKVPSKTESERSTIAYKALESRGITRFGRQQFFFKEASRAVQALDQSFVTQTHERLPGCDIFRTGDGVHALWLERLSKQRNGLMRKVLQFDPYHRMICRNEKLISNDPKTIIVANSELAKTEYLNFLGVPSQRIRLIPNSINVEHWKALRKNAVSKNMARKLFGLKPEAPCMLFVGSGFSRKGVKPLIQAIAVQKRYQLLVVGADKNLKWYQGLAEKLAPGRVRFTGPLDSVASALAASDVFVLPSLYDSFSNAALEAMAYGLPVIVTPDTGIAFELKGNGHGGIVTEANPDALVQAMNNALDNHVQMGSDATTTASRFDHSVIVPKWLELYKEISQSKSP